MDFGLSLIFQDPGNGISDREIVAQQLSLVDLVDPLGFDSVWMTEHHFTSYMLTPEPTQYLTWVAARTPDHIKLGTMAIILPWHDPVRVAEHVSLLDTLSGGRVILGVGRGLGLVEFDGFRIPMGEARERFGEAIQFVTTALNTGVMEFDGQHYKIPKRDLRPRPFKSFKDRSYAAAVSPDSMELVAKLGLGLLVSAQKPWEQTVSDVEAYKATFRNVHGTEAPAPTATAYIYCDEDEARAEEKAHQYIGDYYLRTMAHYNLAGEHFQGTKGYDYYASMASKLDRRGDSSVKFFTDLQVWGTPDQCVEKIEKLRDVLGADRLIGTFSYSDLPHEDALRSMKLFASEVMPRLASPEASPVTTA